MSTTSMQPRRIHIIGGPGSGKSVAAASLGERCGIPVTNLDQLFWDQSAHRYGVRAMPEERAAALALVLNRESWIIEGVYHSWIERSFREADVILVLNVPVWVRDWRILVRFLRRKFGLDESKRESMFDLWKLLRWNHAYDGNNLAGAREILKRLGKSTIECRGTTDVLKVL